MKTGELWRVKIDEQTLATASGAAQRAGIALAPWLKRTILLQAARQELVLEPEARPSELNAPAFRKHPEPTFRPDGSPETQGPRIGRSPADMSLGSSEVFLNIDETARRAVEGHAWRAADYAPDAWVETSKVLPLLEALSKEVRALREDPTDRLLPPRLQEWLVNLRSEIGKEIDQRVSFFLANPSPIIQGDLLKGFGALSAGLESIREMVSLVSEPPYVARLEARVGQVIAAVDEIQANGAAVEEVVSTAVGASLSDLHRAIKAISDQLSNLPPYRTNEDVPGLPALIDGSPNSPLIAQLDIRTNQVVAAINGRGGVKEAFTAELQGLRGDIVHLMELSRAYQRDHAERDQPMEQWTALAATLSDLRGIMVRDIVPSLSASSDRLDRIASSIIEGFHLQSVAHDAATVAAAVAMTELRDGLPIVELSAAEQPPSQLALEIAHLHDTIKSLQEAMNSRIEVQLKGTAEVGAGVHELKLSLDSMSSLLETSNRAKTACSASTDLITEIRALREDIVARHQNSADQLDNFIREIGQRLEVVSTTGPMKLNKIEHQIQKLTSDCARATVDGNAVRLFHGNLKKLERDLAGIRLESIEAARAAAREEVKKDEDLGMSGIDTLHFDLDRIGRLHEEPTDRPSSPDQPDTIARQPPEPKSVVAPMVEKPSQGNLGVLARLSEVYQCAVQVKNHDQIGSNSTTTRTLTPNTPPPKRQ